MDIPESPRGKGFWMGLIVGLGLAAVLAIGLAVMFPPTRYIPPELPRDAVAAPPPPAAPEAVAAPTAPRRGGLLGEPAPAPLIADRPASEMPPRLPGLAPPAAPDRFDGSASGSPSLVP